MQNIIVFEKVINDIYNVFNTDVFKKFNQQKKEKTINSLINSSIDDIEMFKQYLKINKHQKILDFIDNKNLGNNAICLAINDGYIKYAKVLIKSIISNNPNFNYDIVIVNDEECNISEQSLMELRNIYPKVIRKYMNLSNRIKTFMDKFKGHIPQANWYYSYLKLYAFELDEYDKVLYLDSDIVVNGSIMEIFQSTDDIDMCIDLYTPEMCKLNYLNYQQIQDKDIWIEYNYQYCNAGVIFFGNREFRKRLYEEFIDFALLYDFSFIQMSNRKDICKNFIDGYLFEQDVLNYYLFKNKDNIKCRIMPIKYNTCTSACPSLIDDAIILHYWIKPNSLVNELYNCSYLPNSTTIKCLDVYNKYADKKISYIKHKKAVCIILNNILNYKIIINYIYETLSNNDYDIYIYDYTDNFSYNIKALSSLYYYKLNIFAYKYFSNNIKKLYDFIEKELNNVYDNIEIYNDEEIHNQVFNFKINEKEKIESLIHKYVTSNGLFSMLPKQVRITYLKKLMEKYFSIKHINYSLKNIITLLKNIHRYDLIELLNDEFEKNYRLFNIEDYNITNKKAVCAIMKNTNDTLFHKWIEYYLEHNFDIYISEDENSYFNYEKYVTENFPGIENIHICKLDNNFKNQLTKKYIELGLSFMHFQYIINQEMYENVENYYTWVTILDDDEFINISDDLLDAHENTDITALIIPWKLKYNAKTLFNNYDFDEYKTYDLFNKKHKEQKDLNDDWPFKYIVNTKNVKNIENVHYATRNDVFYSNGKYYHMYDIMNDINIFYDIIDKNNNNWIDHYYILGFEQFVSKIYDRGDFFIKYKGRYYNDNAQLFDIPNRTIYNYYEYFNPNITISNVINDLKTIGREDIVQKIYDDPFINAYKIKLDEEFLKLVPMKKLEEKYSKDVVEKYLKFIN